MKEETDYQHVKRTQRDYSYAFKLQVVREVESGETGIKAVSSPQSIGQVFAFS